MKSQNESPFSNPRFLLVLLVTFVSLWGWQYYMNAKYPNIQKNNLSATNTTGEKKAETAISNSVNSQSEVKEVSSVLNGTTNAANFQEEKFSYADENVAFTITSIGFGFSDFILNDYKSSEFKPITFTNEKSIFNLLNKKNKIPFKITASEDKLTYTGVAKIGDIEVSRVLKYNKIDRYFESEINFSEGLDELTINIDQEQLITKSKNFLMPSFDHQDFVNVIESKTVSDRISGVKETEVFSKNHENIKLASIGSQYFTVSIIDSSDLAPKVLNTIQNHLATMNLEYVLTGTKIKTVKQKFYLGPKKTEILQKVDPILPDVLNYGVFGFISKILLQLLKLIHGFVGNWGLAIIVLTLLVRGVLMPFNVMSFRSAQSMQKIKPQMDALREKYKADPMRMNKETMALMKQNNANPLSGCLPMLLQIPIFFAFFAMISTSIELYHQPFFGWIQDLSSYDHFFVLPILMGITMFFQQKLTPTTMDPTQAKILSFMPIIFTLFMLTLPSGLTLYNFVSALFGVTQQFFLLKDSKLKQIN